MKCDGTGCGAIFHEFVMKWIRERRVHTRYEAMKRRYESWQYPFFHLGIDPHKHHVLVPKSLSAFPSYNYFEFASQLQLPTNTTQSL